jgi:hypothetical protein
MGTTLRGIGAVDLPDLPGPGNLDVVAQADTARLELVETPDGPGTRGGPGGGLSDGLSGLSESNMGSIGTTPPDPGTAGVKADRTDVVH